MHFRWVALFWVPVAFVVLTAYQAAADDKKNYSIHNSAQAGFEYDSNVFKTFGAGQSDSLLRVLLKSRGDFALNRQASTGWAYQGGGKKYFEHGEQDLIIQYIQVPFQWRPHSRVSFVLAPDFKYQKEDGSVDGAQPPFDINEDYWSTTTRLTIYTLWPGSFQVQPYGEFQRFGFGPRETFSFFRERGGLLVRRQFGDLFALGAEYLHSRQQFLGITRADREHNISGFFQLLGTPFFSGRYTYQDSNSNDNIFSFTNHRITLLFSIPILSKDEPIDPAYENGAPALFSLHVLATIQIKNFPDVFVSTEEGERFLLTDSEDDNFNSIVVKLTAHPTRRWAIETKLTRYSNEFSSQEDSFSRYLAYAGARFSF